MGFKKRSFTCCKIFNTPNPLRGLERSIPKGNRVQECKVLREASDNLNNSILNNFPNEKQELKKLIDDSKHYLVKSAKKILNV